MKVFHTEKKKTFEVVVSNNIVPPLKLIHSLSGKSYYFVSIAQHDNELLAIYLPNYESEHTLFARPLSMMFDFAAPGTMRFVPSKE